jgi:pimeloyl-ACP methyl ester carboxylesterase
LPATVRANHLLASLGGVLPHGSEANEDPMTSRPTSVFVNDLWVTFFGPADGQPVLLVHGSTETGTHDFCVGSDLAARLAAAGYRVIVPDCPGHGRSAAERHPDGSVVYSFARMAAQLSNLLVAIGAQRAHVIGHSNGGTVALYLARFHAPVVGKVVALAGNAYLDERIIVGVPPKMAPDRIERERPEWQADMVELHDTWHGGGYWRELVQATIDETIANPQWAAGELVDMHTKVLAVQGSEDTVNTPGRHAQVIGEWFPNGSSWIVDGAGHSVHWERGDEFFARVHSFFAEATSAKAE